MFNIVMKNSFVVRVAAKLQVVVIGLGSCIAVGAVESNPCTHDRAAFPPRYERAEVLNSGL